MGIPWPCMGPGRLVDGISSMRAFPGCGWFLAARLIFLLASFLIMLFMETSILLWMPDGVF